jgi:hypothetical protein
MRIRILFQFRSSAPAGIRRGAFRRARAIFAILLHNRVHRSHAHGFFLLQLRISVFTIARDWVNSW